MQQQLRDTMEVEQEDWPDALVNASIREGYERIVAKDERWPFYEARWQLAVVEGRSVYELVEVGDVKEVTSMRLDSGARMDFTDEDAAEVRWTAPGSPAEWSRWGGSIKLWPVPSSDAQVEIRGYRTPRVFLAQSAWVPDLPERFHPLLLDWALGNEYQRQDDTEMMTSYRNKFEEQLTTLHKSSMAVPSPGPLVVAGNARKRREWWR